MFTSRLILRALSESDASVLSELRSDESVNLYINRPKQISKEDALAWINRTLTGIEEGKFFYWCITLRENPSELVGTICLWNFSADRKTAEIGYELLPRFQRQGYMDEALKCIIDFAENHERFTSLEALIRKENKASIGLAEKNGFVLTERKVEDEPNLRVYRRSVSV